MLCQRLTSQDGLQNGSQCSGVQVKCSVVRLSSYNSRIPSMAAAHPNDALFVRLKPRCDEGAQIMKDEPFGYHAGWLAQTPQLAWGSWCRRCSIRRAPQYCSQIWVACTRSPDA